MLLLLLFFSKTLVVTHEYKYLNQVMDIVSPILDVLGMDEGYIEAAIKALILPTTFESWSHKMV